LIYSHFRHNLNAYCYSVHSSDKHSDVHPCMPISDSVKGQYLFPEVTDLCHDVRAISRPTLFHY